MPHVLLFEYLHADGALFRESPASMRAEGRAMLLAVQADLAGIADVETTVVCSTEAAGQLEVSPGIRLHSIDATSPARVAQAVCSVAAADDVVIPIAPECDGILATIVEELRTAGVNVIAPHRDAINDCADKWRTHQLLRRHDLPTIPTCLADNMEETLVWPDQLWVVKPRDGAGCLGIFKARRDDAVFTAATSGDATESWVVQPWIDAESFSVGVIGQGCAPPLVLPLARQRVEWTMERPRYVGGEILPALPHLAETDFREICRRVAAAINLKAGYVGVDFLLPRGSTELLITELNPRLCASYVGYRRATSTNLASRLLQRNHEEPIIWNTEVVCFDSSG